MTRGGIEYNFKLSPFKVEEYGFIFVFSSELHAQKFREQLPERVDIINDSLSNRFNIFINAEIVAAFRLYVEIEQRGFLVYDLNGKGVIKCLNQLRLNIARKI